MSFLNDLFQIQDEEEIIGLNSELKSLYLYNRFQKKHQSILFVTTNLHEAGKIYNALTHHTDQVWFFPMDDFLTSEAIAISPEFKTSRLETINNLLTGKPSIVITNLMGYLRFLPSKQNFKDSYLELETGHDYQLDDLVTKLFKLGYKRETTVNMTGELAVRGFVLDVFPLNSENPLRLEFWGDTLDSLKTFNVDTQRTMKDLKKITIYPNTEFLIDEDTFDIPYRDLYKYTEVTNIAGYMNEPLVVFDDYHNLLTNYEILTDEIINYNQSVERAKDTKYMHELTALNPKETLFFETFVNYNNVKNTQFYQCQEIEYFPKTVEGINNRLKKYLKSGKYVVICLDSRYQINKLIDNLANNQIIYTNESKLFLGKINVLVKNLNSGFETSKYIVITKRELFNQNEESHYHTKFRYGSRIKDITKLEIGDYVVHGTHGIGRYLGIRTMNKNGVPKDYLTVEYREQDKLYIPVEKLDLITKYSGKEGATPKLNKLGSHEWAKTKAKARKHAEDMAAELLDLYAKREAKKGFAFDHDTEEQIEFEKQFEYTETLDQIRVTDEIKKDMESSKPMDRLLCGDVGYGKTEVAFRAIFKCILSGKQAALLCPTTILSSQHYQNALKRFQAFPVKIEILNRFVNPHKIKEILKDLKEGKIDLLIGTHRILSDDVDFKDLGLLVIDEEQRFGVKHKEKIKKYKNNVDVLTLSATPIPRTLQMSMAGIRSLSMIETPPVDRYPIQTYVLAENNQIIKEAIYKELARHGQTFILFNHIQNMEQKLHEIQTLVPDATIACAHGQMSKAELENIMFKFNNHEFDILLCTTIIETGIDIPTVNTLIVIDADRFGLSQLYQIRGRIGRSNKIAYCYLMYDNKKILSEVAVKRLKVIKDFTQLGSGFAIAMRDLSIRGAGDILGSQQAGFIDSIGIELFLEMLNEEVQKLQGKEIKHNTEEETSPLIEVKTAIDDNYVSEEELKIEIHQKINTIDSYEKLISVKNELEDRFGKVSEDLIIYMHEEWFEKLAEQIGINQIRQMKNFVEITLDKDLTKKVDGETLFYEVSQLSRMFRFSLKFERLIITLDTIKLEKHFIYYLIDLMQILAKSLKK